MKVSDFKIVGSEVKICQQYPNFKLDGIIDRIDQYDKYLKSLIINQVIKTWISHLQSKVFIFKCYYI